MVRWLRLFVVLGAGLVGAGCTGSAPEVVPSESASGPNSPVIATVEVGRDPREPLVLPDGSAVYVPNHDSGTVSVIDPATNTTAATITVDSSSFPGAAVVLPDGSAVYVVGCVALPDGTAVYVPNSDDGTVPIIGRP